jgi:hypothetical protein
LPSLSSAKSSTKNFDIKTVHESTQDEVATRNDAAPISTISKDPDDVEKSSNSGNTKQDRIAKDSSRSASSSSEDHDEAEKRLRTILEMHLSTENRAEAGLVSDVTGNNQQILDVIKSDEVIQEDHFATPNNNISYASTSSSSSSERQQNETPILPPPSVGSSSISSNGLELPSGPESPESSSSGTDSRSEAKNEGHSRDKLPPLRNEAKMIEAIVEHDNHPPLDQSKEPNGLVTVPKPPVRRSLLGTLPPLVDPSKDQQPLRRQNKAVEFKDPLHSSIPRLFFF